MSIYIMHSHPILVNLITLLSLYAFILSPPVNAGENESLSLNMVLRMAVQNNLTLRQQELMVQQASAQKSVQQAGYYPSLSAGALSTWVFFNQPPVTMPGDNDRVSINIFSLSIEQPIFRGFRTVNSVNMAEGRVTLQKMVRRSMQDQLLLQTGLLYYDLQLNLLSQDVLRQSMLRTQNQLEKTRNLLAADQVTWFDTLEVANRQLELATSLTEIEGTYAILQDKLAHLLNVSELPAVSLRPVESPVEQTESLADLKQIALMNRPELAAIRAKRNLQHYQIEMNKAAFYPVVSASGGYNYGLMDGFFFTGEWVDFYNIMINFQWELWDWNRDKNKVQQSKLEYQRLDLEEQQLLLDVASELKEVYEHCEIKARQIELHHQLCKQEKDRYEITNERYQQGLSTALDLSSAEHSLTSAELKLQQAHIDWYKNQLRLLYATGRIGHMIQEVDR